LRVPSRQNPISTPFFSTSPQDRRRSAESRTGAIIRAILKSRYTELYALVFVALGLLAFWGTNAEGQSPLIDSWARRYVEEKGFARPQLADVSGLFVGTGGDSATDSPLPTLESTTIRDSAFVALAPPDADYMNALALRHAQVMEYVVQDGDRLSFIASDFGVSINSIIWANNLKNADSISPGQILRIPPVSGLLYKAKQGDSADSLAKKYSADADRIIAYNHLSKDGSIDTGEEIVIPDGHPAAVAVSPPTGNSTSSLDRKIKRVGIYTQAGSILTALKFSYLPDLGDFFKIPTTGFNWGILHDRNGVDIANSCGTPVYAAAGGTITVADPSGWNGGFGKYIKIGHENGTETLYGHLSKILVSPNQAIEKGQKIGLMGTTGRSTGCHLHFEVHGARNPLAKY